MKIIDEAANMTKEMWEVRSPLRWDPARVAYKTERGSKIYPLKLCSWSIDFDWYEEGACCDAMPEVDEQDQSLVWSCPCCVSGRAALKPLST